MGTFADIFKAEGSTIPEDKRQEFAKRVEKIFRAGGMMGLGCAELCGRRIDLLKELEMEDGKFFTYYNYFENDTWESAGFDEKNCKLWSNKIGWAQFHLVVVAAYVMEEMYEDGTACAMVDGNPVTSWGYVGWLNYLFHEKKHIKNYDPWSLFEEMHKENPVKSMEYINWEKFLGNGYLYIGTIEILAVTKGVEYAMETAQKHAAEQKEKPLISFICSAMTEMLEQIERYVDVDKKKREKRAQNLMKLVISHCESPVDKYKQCAPEKEPLEEIHNQLKKCDAPALFVKKVSDLLEKDFWELWKSVKGERRKLRALYDANNYYIVPIPTTDFLQISPDDMIPYWTPDDNEIIFSDELKDWFSSLKKEYDDILSEEHKIDNMLQFVVDQIWYGVEKCYGAQVFDSFFEETLNHLNENAYQALWILYGKMVHDSKYHENTEKPDKLACRRYMALMANKPLRSKVFGF